MEFSKLGETDLRVSRVCMGTMTWGGQNKLDESLAMLEYALQSGINFFDTAELYPIPVDPATYADSERVIGHWLRQNKDRRKELILATKIAGRGVAHIRDGNGPDRGSIIQAVKDSLERMHTDYIDLFQIHWPSRAVPHFAKHWPGTINPARTDPLQQARVIQDILEGLRHCLDAGMIRYAGLSNETPWGVDKYLQIARQQGLPSIVSVQNELSLLHTKDWPYMIEACALNKVAYLAWSPLAGGALSGKYSGGKRPPGSRWTFNQRQGLFRDTPESDRAVSAYSGVAAEYGLTPAQLALAWVNQVSGVSSVIIGATSTEQLSENLAAFELKLSPECMTDILKTLKLNPAPF